HLSDPGNYAQHWVASSQRLREKLEYRELVSRAEAVRRTVERELANPPEQFPEETFNYAAEDAALA
ncbi:MAG TPA: hypothetical protein VG498_12145, partial [Terriglobales bacterium]|nr:hypothetical protein [Terriglobales bacterium]